MALLLDVLMEKDESALVLAKAEMLVHAEHHSKQFVGCCLLSRTNQTVSVQSRCFAGHLAGHVLLGSVTNCC